MNDNVLIAVLILGPYALLFGTIFLLTRDKSTTPLRCRLFGHTAFRKIPRIGCYGPYDHCGRCGHPLEAKP